MPDILSIWFCLFFLPLLLALGAMFIWTAIVMVLCFLSACVAPFHTYWVLFSCTATSALRAMIAEVRGLMTPRYGFVFSFALCFLVPGISWPIDLASVIGVLPLVRWFPWTTSSMME